jgi:hypothetical protein
VQVFFRKYFDVFWVDVVNNNIDQSYPGLHAEVLFQKGGGVVKIIGGSSVSA